MQVVRFKDHKRIAFADAWAIQTELVRQMVDQKRIARGDDTIEYQPNHHLIMCEHNPVFTLGRSGKVDHLLLNSKNLTSLGFEFFKINRGGDITYHGPGQLVVYPILDLDFFFNDLHKYVRLLEEAVIRLLQRYDLNAFRIKEYTGVWLDAIDGRKKKICAIGVHLSRWITMHGLALNVNTNLRHFDHIVPCGIQDDDKAVTSMQQELGHTVDFDEVKNHFKEIFRELFGYEYS